MSSMAERNRSFSSTLRSCPARATDTVAPPLTHHHPSCSCYQDDDDIHHHHPCFWRVSSPPPASAPRRGRALRPSPAAQLSRKAQLSTCGRRSCQRAEGAAANVRKAQLSTCGPKKPRRRQPAPAHPRGYTSACTPTVTSLPPKRPCMRLPQPLERDERYGTREAIELLVAWS